VVEKSGGGRGYTKSAQGAYVPPNNIEAEQSTLGSMLIEKRAIIKACKIVGPGDFYRETHQWIFDAILSLVGRGFPVDLVTIQEELKNVAAPDGRSRFDAIGVMYLTALFEVTPSAANVEHYARIVQGKSILRQLVAMSLEVIGMARGEVEDVGEVVRQAHDAILSVRMGRVDDRGPKTMRVIVEQVYAEIEAAGESDAGFLTGLETGWPELDALVGGYQPDDYGIICGDRGSGKSWTAQWSILHCALKVKKGVYHVSQEMRNVRVGRRALATASGVPSQRFRTGRLSQDHWDNVNAGVGQLYTDLWMVDDRPSLKPSEILQGVIDYKRWLEDQGEQLGLIVVDYLQLCKAERDYREKRDAISSISGALREMAADLLVPTLALSQLTRSALRNRSNKRPIPSDLAESGDIESDASLILAPFRPAFYERHENPDLVGTRGDNDVDDVEMLILKSRDGDQGIYFRTKFDPRIGRYESVQSADDPGSTAF